MASNHFVPLAICQLKLFNKAQREKERESFFRPSWEERDWPSLHLSLEPVELELSGNKCCRHCFFWSWKTDRWLWDTGRFGANHWRCVCRTGEYIRGVDTTERFFLYQVTFFFSKAIGKSRGSIRTTDEQVFVKKETVYFSVPFV